MCYRAIIAGLIAVFLSACSRPQTAVPTFDNAAQLEEQINQREIVQRDWEEALGRINPVAYDVNIATVELCENRIYEIGLAMDFARAVDPVFYEVRRRIYGLIPDHFSIYRVVRGQAGEEAGLKVGDRVRQIGQDIIPRGAKKLEAWASTIRTYPNDGAPFSFVVDRAGQRLEFSVLPRLMCNVPLTLVVDENVNAFTNGETITFSTAMVRFAKSDDELALIYGHEMAHILRNHIEAKKQNAGVGVLVGLIISAFTGMNVAEITRDIGTKAWSQDFESEADYVGAYLTARAGYDVSGAAQFMRRLATLHPEAIHGRRGATHPSTVNRYLVLQQAADEIAQKKAAGLDLLPNLKGTN